MKHILIVEDDKVLNQQLNFHLTKHGFFVQSVFTYEDAYDKIKKEHFELIILDIRLNNNNGLYLCPIIKEMTNSAIVFLSAKDSEPDILCGYESGADDYIVFC